MSSRAAAADRTPRTKESAGGMGGSSWGGS
jgi:hypothetical protein